MDLLEHFRALLSYEAGCTPIVADALGVARRHVDNAGLASLAAPLQRAMAIFSHIQAARQLWLSRVSDLATPPEGGVFPLWELERSRARGVEMDELWAVFLSRQSASSLSARVRYTSTEGRSFESAIADVITHVVNHSSYHRGQIAMLTAATGTQPTPTDLIVLTRTPV